MVGRIDYSVKPRTMLYENETVTMNRGDYTTCTINLHGATITSSWRFEDEEQLFVSRLSRFCGLLQTRGGVAFVFPQFGSWFFGPRHGFVRNQRWNLEEGPLVNEDLDVYSIFSLSSSAYTESMWNYNFRLVYKITLCEKKIESLVIVENLSKYFPFEYDILQHSLLKVPDVSKCQLIGLKDRTYHDQLKGGEELLVEDREEVTISEWTDRIYHDVPHPILLTHIMDDRNKLEIGKDHEKDINLWNPWEDMSKDLQDLDEDEYKYFVAVEPGKVLKKKIRLEPMSCWRAKTSLRVVEPKIERRGHFYDLFDRCC